MLLEWLLKNNKVRLMLNIIWTNCFLLQFIPWHWFYIKLVCQSPNLKPTGMGWQLIGNSLVVYNGAYLDNDYMITQLPLVLIFYDSIPSSVAQEVQQLTIAEQVYYTFDGHLTWSTLNSDPASSYFINMAPNGRFKKNRKKTSALSKSEIQYLSENTSFTPETISDWHKVTVLPCSCT